jgi:hypothetical protein
VTPQPASSFCGIAGRSLGTFHVSRETTDHCACDSVLSQLRALDADVTIGTQWLAGTSELQPGTEHHADQNADGNRTMPIVSH